jgi:hypothetical protein
VLAEKPHVLFAGPSLHGLPHNLLSPNQVLLRPPARRGDIDCLVNQTPRVGKISLADGLFHSELAVSHAELRRALQQGWEVWGVSSMGAIRACEMHHMGMKGVGQVYESFVADPDLSDDEVALLHSPRMPYHPTSEPLIHIRLFLEHMVTQGHLASDSATQILQSLKNRWFGYRTLDLLTELISSNIGHSNDHVADWVSMMPEFRIKNRDLAAFLGDQSSFEKCT